MNRQKAQLYFSVFAVTGAAAVVACGSISPYPQEDPNGTYPAGYQYPGASSSGGGGTTDGGGGCIPTEAGTVCPEAGPPPIVCMGCTQVAAAMYPQSISLDSTHIHWTEGSGQPWMGSGGAGDIKEAARGGTASATNVIVPGLTGPFILKEANSWLVWSNLGGGGAGQTSVDSWMLGSSGAPNVVGPSLHQEHGVALDATNVYWVSSDPGAVYAIVQSAPLAGGAVNTLGTTTIPMVGEGVVVNSTSLFFVGYEPTANIGYVNQVPLTGGVPTQIWTSPTMPSNVIDLATDGTNLYWTDFAAGNVYSMPIAGGAVTTMATGITNPLTIAVDSTNVYFTSLNEIYEEPIGSTSPNVLVTGVNGTEAVAADDTDTWVYFTTQSAILAHVK